MTSLKQKIAENEQAIELMGLNKLNYEPPKIISGQDITKITEDIMTTQKLKTNNKNLYTDLYTDLLMHKCGALLLVAAIKKNKHKPINMVSKFDNWLDHIVKYPSILYPNIEIWMLNYHDLEMSHHIVTVIVLPNGEQKILEKLSDIPKFLNNKQEVN
jgi:hypothetical protein